MQPKLIPKDKVVFTPLGEYAAAKWDGKNRAGCEPINERVLILPDGAAEKTTGNVHIPQEMQERMSMAAESGVLIAISEDAWTRSADRTGPYRGKKPEVGERVYFERYAGQIHHGKDGTLYRLMDDACVGGIVTE
jgi:co-chaperonin GroES (HSP10)